MNITELSSKSERLIEISESAKIDIKALKKQSEQSFAQVKALSGKAAAAKAAYDKAKKSGAKDTDALKSELEKSRTLLREAQRKSAHLEGLIHKSEAELKSSEKDLTDCARQVKELINQYSAGIAKAKALTDLHGASNSVALRYGLEQGKKKSRELHEKIAKTLGIIENISDALEGGTVIKSFERGRRGFVEEFKKSTLPEGVIGKITANCKSPASRAKAIHTAFCDTPQEIIDLITELMPKLNHVQTTDSGCYYMRGCRYINMDDTRTDAEFAEVFQHEFGHFVDDVLGNVSSTTEYKAAFSRDKVKFGDPLKYDIVDKMLDEAFETGAAYDRCVCDIISATFRNHPHVKESFYKRGFPYYAHDNAYWNRQGSDVAEIFANIFSIESAQYTHSRDFVKKWFPCLYEETLKNLYKEKK